MDDAATARDAVAILDYSTGPINQFDLHGHKGWFKRAAKATGKFIKKRWVDIALIGIMVVPGLGAVAWGVRAYRVAKTVSSVYKVAKGSKMVIQTSRGVAKSAAKRIIGKPRTKSTGSWLGSGSRYLEAPKVSTGAPLLKITPPTRGSIQIYPSSPESEQKNVHIKHRR